MQIEDGAHLVVADKDTVIDTSFGTISIDRHSVVLLVVKNSAVSVYDLDDTHKGAVKVSVGGDEMVLAPGRHLTLAAGAASSFADVNPVPFVAHRHESVSDLKSGGKAFHSQFSLPTLLAGLKAMQKSETRAQQIAFRHLMKTAAVLSTMSQGSESYHLVLPEELASQKLSLSYNRASE
jgi:hypothetical protein